MAKKFKGIGCPCVTPFEDDGSINLVSLREIVDYLINNEINAIIPGTHCGESYTFRDSEYKELIDTVVDQVNEAVPVYVAFPSESLQRLLELTKYAVDTGVDGVVIYPPKIPGLTEKALISYYEFLFKEIDTNILFVNEPNHVGIDLSIDEIEQISDFNNVVGMIELSSDFNKIKQISSVVSDSFYLYTGRGLLVPQALTEAEVEGAIVPSANVVPNLLVELFEAHKVDMKERFEEIQTLLIPLEIGLKLAPFPVAIKACLNHLGIKVNSTRRPLLSLSETDNDKLRNILISAGCIRPPSEDSQEEKEKSQETENKNSQKEG